MIHPVQRGGQSPTSSLPPFGRYRHFKGGAYELFEFARHSETDEVCAVYRDVGDRTIFVRPLTMFVEEVDRPEGPVPRFKLERRERSRSRYARMLSRLTWRRVRLGGTRAVRRIHA